MGFGRFFGFNDTAASVVVVFDISGSMINRGLSPENYNVLETEIIRLIESLPLGSRFGLVAFGDRAESYAASLRTSNRTEKDRAVSWLKSLNPGLAIKNPAGKEDLSLAFWKDYRSGFHAGTRADLGLRAALKLAPDIVYFVSDGDPTFNGHGLLARNPDQLLQVVQEWQEKNREPIPITTISFKSPKRLVFMEALAKQNKGEHRVVE
ncbi:MAG: vWA domain-containing protein [Verrucomicrobiota bacterium]